MSRLARFARALVSGYALLAANTLYTLASFPLALRYLSPEEFGLWCLMFQVAGYMALVDAGMSGSVARILIDYKDRPETGDYGSVVLTSSLVGVVQGILVLAVGVVLAVGTGPLLHVPTALSADFVRLMLGQSALQAIAFAVRFLSLILTAHQRYDVLNWSQTILVGVNFAVLWAGFALKFGVYSIIASQAVVTVLGVGINAWGCWALNLFPAQGCWGRPTWRRFRELFAFGKDVFLYSVGYQLVAASQTLLITRELNLNMVTIWTGCTRMYFLLSQLILKIFDYGYPAFSEMLVRGESGRLSRAFRLVASCSVSVSVVAAALLGVCNQPFVAIWTRHQIAWSVACDIALAGLLPLTVLVRVHIGLIGVTKDFRFLRFLYLCEGILLVAFSTATLRHYGLLALILSSFVASLAVSLPYALWRTVRFFRLDPWSTVLQWCYPAIRVAIPLAPVAVGVGWLARYLTAPYSLVVCGVTVGSAGLVLLWHFGLDCELKNEIRFRLPKRRLPGQPTNIA